MRRLLRGPKTARARAQRAIIGRDARIENIHGKEVLLRTGAEAEEVYGERITIEAHCRIDDGILQTDELRLAENVSLAKNPKRTSTLSHRRTPIRDSSRQLNQRGQHCARRPASEMKPRPKSAALLRVSLLSLLLRF